MYNTYRLSDVDGREDRVTGNVRSDPASGGLHTEARNAPIRSDLTVPAQSSARTKLLDAARSLLWERGYEAMSPRTVLDRAGAGQGSLYHHFDGKGDLAAAAMQLIADEMKAHTDMVFDPAKPPLQRIDDYLAAPRDGTKGCKLGRLANENAVTGPAADGKLRSPLAGYFRHVEAAVLAALREAQRDGNLPTGLDCGAVAQTLVATVQGGFVLSRVHNDDHRFTIAAQGARAMIDALCTAIPKTPEKE